jgi:hypothetical protein
VILRCNYEEVEALRAGARALLDRGDDEGRSPVLAPPESRARVEALLPRLQGDLSVYTLEDQRALQVGIDAIVEQLREEMESAVLATHPADESAVNAYFAFAHGRMVASRVGEIGEEMVAIIELVTGDAPSPEAVRSFRFPD